MITICPQCHLTLSITAADLRVAQGQVRCGRCATVFNALNYLFEESSGTEELPAEPAEDAPPPSLSTAEATPGADDGASEDNSEAANEPFMDPAEDLHEAANDSALELPERPLFQLIEDAAPAPEPELLPESPPETPVENDIAAPAAAPDRFARLYPAAVILLSLALVAQLAHQNRDVLATLPSVNRPISALYAALGQPLAPNWNVRGYEVRQLGAIADTDANANVRGVLTVRATLRNTAAHAQPAPLLRLTLQDRYGNRIASRDLAPLQYGAEESAFLDPGGRIEATVRLLDPGSKAVGFELDACLPQGTAGIRCANDGSAAQ